MDKDIILWISHRSHYLSSLAQTALRPPDGIGKDALREEIKKVLTEAVEKGERE